MPKAIKTSAPIIGIIFLALAVLKFLQGDSWVVWVILAFIFGGFGIFNFGRSEGDRT